MTTREDDTHHNIDDAWLLELLVDDELTPEQRDDLLARLDAQPGGWKRCAAAFLEAQAVRRAVRVTETDLVGPASRLSPHEPLDRRDGCPTAQASATACPTVSFRLRRFIPAAAAALLAFAAGVILANAMHSPPVDALRDHVAATSPPANELATDVQTVGRDVAAPSALTTADPRPFVFDQQQVDGVPRYITHEAVPLFMLQAIRDAGHEVEFVRQSVPVTMNDGQQIDVPLIETRITPKRRFDL